MKYRPEIDGLRTIAVLPVILFHAGISFFQGGFVGVDIFFVISGYLITTLLLGDIEAGQFSILTFYERRVRRILPALFTVMLATLPFAYFFLLPTEFEAYGKSLIAVPTFVSNILFWSERGYFGAASELKPLVHTWSLAVEEQFYIAFPPLLAWMASRRLELQRGLFLLAFGLSLAASWYLTRLHFETGFYLPLSRIWELLTGAACAIHLRKRTPVPGVAGTVMAGVGLALIFYAIFVFDSGTVFPGVMAGIPVAGTALIILAAPVGNPVLRLLASRPFVWIGLISYSLYLWHQPIFAFLRHAGHEAPAELLASVPIVFLASWLSFRFVETPVRRNRALARQKIFGWALAGSLFFIAVGAIIVATRGMIDRYPPEDVAIMEQFSELADYSETAYNAAQFRPFDNSGRRKVVISGDSYARDFYNIVREAGLEKTYQFSTKRVNSECGNVLTTKDLTPHISARKEERCRLMGRLDNPDLQPMLKQADEIWLVSRWFDWVIDYLPETIENLEKTYDAKIRVFGVKNLGEVSLPWALSIPAEKRLGYRQPAAPFFVQVNKHFRRMVPDRNRVELLDPFCEGNHVACPVFDAKGRILTIDGGHLSPAGAQYFAPLVRQIVTGGDSS